MEGLDKKCPADIVEPSISICIPTYNRSEFIGGCLDSILPQLKEQMEVLILDGGSSDRTPDVVEAYRSRCPQIRYIRSDTNQGVDEDILRVVDLAKGDFCWLMSDDDQLEDGSIAHVMQRMRQYHNLAGASLNSVAFDRTMSFRVRTVPAIGHDRIRSDRFFQNSEECFAKLGIHLGFLSAQVVRRELWQAVARSSDLTPYKGSCWILVFMIGSMLKRNPNWLYIHRPCVRNRTGNDSFIERLGTLRRQHLTHVSYAAVLHKLYDPKSPVSHQVLATLVADRMPRTLANTKASGASLALQAKLMALYTGIYWRYPTYWWKVFPLFFIPGLIFRMVRSVYLQTMEMSHVRGSKDKRNPVSGFSAERHDGAASVEKKH